MTDASIDEEVVPLIHSSNNSIQRRNFPIYLILIGAGFERLAFYSLAGNLTFFLDSHLIRWTFPHTIIAPLIFLGISYISSLIFSCVSDGKLGRANTILIGFILYIFGYVFLVLLSNETIHQSWCPSSINSTNIDQRNFFNELCVEFLLPALILTAIGVGAVQANMTVFGADQFRDQKSRTQYFDIYYAVINTGGLIAFGAIAYLQINTNYFIGYLVPGSLLILGLISFSIGYRFYIHIDRTESLLSQFPSFLIDSLRTWWNQRRNQIDHHQRFSNVVVDDIKSLRRIIIVFLLLIPYWLLYVQVETTFIVQGAHMKLPTRFDKMPVVWLSLGNQLIIIVSILFLNGFVYKRLRASGRSFSIRSRILIGMIAAAVAMCFAGTVEIRRQKICETQNFTQTIGDKNYLAANMTVFYQFPQYVFIGLSEVFTSVASLEFAYLAAPRSAQSLIMSLRFCSAGFSSLFGSGIVALLSIESKNEPIVDYHNDPRYYIYFFVLAAIEIFFVLIFIGCNRKNELLKLPNLHLDLRRFQSST